MVATLKCVLLLNVALYKSTSLKFFDWVLVGIQHQSMVVPGHCTSKGLDWTFQRPIFNIWLLPNFIGISYLCTDWNVGILTVRRLCSPSRALCLGTLVVEGRFLTIAHRLKTTSSEFLSILEYIQSVGLIPWQTCFLNRFIPTLVRIRI